MAEFLYMKYGRGKVGNREKLEWVIDFLSMNENLISIRVWS